MSDTWTPDGYGGKAAMFFAGLILLIPHRIGMSRVNYVIKRYNLPISRAGLLLYKYHNNIELSLLFGTLPGNIIVWCVGKWAYGTDKNKEKNKVISYCMITFLILMLLSSIIMFIIYISGGDFGHLNAFYFSLIFLTLFDGFTNAFAFALNGKNASLLSAGIPLSGFLVTILHYIYKFFFDLFHWDNFDYYVLRLQLFLNILTILIALILWSKFEVSSKAAPSLDLRPLFKSTADYSDASDKKDAHIYDWSPILMLALSLGTVYAFYPSIAPYSIIDFQYASVIELWILIISALLPFTFAILDLWGYGPSGTSGTQQTLSGTSQITINNTININFSSQFTNDELTLSNIKIKHPKNSADNNKYHKGGTCSLSSGDDQNTWHDWKTVTDTATYTIASGDQYWNTYKPTPGEDPIPKDSSYSVNNTTITIFYTPYKNWYLNSSISSVTLAPKDAQSNTADLKVTANPTDANKITINSSSPSADSNNYSFWNLVWICAIFYILCIQIFMSLLHYPHSLLSCFFNHPFRIQFISVFFNTLRELMQACAFSGAGKQVTSLNNSFTFGEITFDNLDTYEVKGDANIKESGISTAGQLKLPKLFLTTSGSTANPLLSSAVTSPFTDIQATASFKVPYLTLPIPFPINGSIAATNKLITLFVMMFCVFTGDGYLQHYRRCCRDNWPTTGYNKYQSFFYWLRYGFKGGIKSITSSFTDLYYHNK